MKAGIACRLGGFSRSLESVKRVWEGSVVIVPRTDRVFSWTYDEVMEKTGDVCFELDQKLLCFRSSLV